MTAIYLVTDIGSKTYLSGRVRTNAPTFRGLRRDDVGLEVVVGLNPTWRAVLSIKAFCKGVREFQTYIANNAHAIPNYTERHRYGERVSTAFVESMVNTVVGKRFSKKLQMQWSKSGAHLMLQVRTRVLDSTLRSRLQSWHPGLFNPANSNQAMDRMVA